MSQYFTVETVSGKPLGKIHIEWSSTFAYAVGLIVSDGCLSKDGRHIDFTSKDRSQVALFKKCLGLHSKISPKYSGAGNVAYHTQFGDVLFYRYLLGLGLSPAKSKTISRLSIPDEFFFDFLRGYFDGDGCTYSFYDSIFKNSFRFYISFISASRPYLVWLQKEILEKAGVHGYLNPSGNRLYFQLKYSKREALKLCPLLYYRDGLPCLRRKHLKILKSMRIIELSRSGEIGRRAAFRAQ
ncbi:LAGLIDADG family homing endonuclease [Candidatus Kaiserbacteria bacterium]|nr:LAGLIDADG family homing endonuclease [Candidatus Kaiserbacteria bacterium]